MSCHIKGCSGLYKKTAFLCNKHAVELDDRFASPTTSAYKDLEQENERLRSEVAAKEAELVTQVIENQDNRFFIIKLVELTTRKGTHLPAEKACSSAPMDISDADKKGSTIFDDFLAQRVKPDPDALKKRFPEWFEPSEDQKRIENLVLHNNELIKERDFYKNRQLLFKRYRAFIIRSLACTLRDAILHDLPTDSVFTTFPELKPKVIEELQMVMPIIVTGRDHFTRKFLSHELMAPCDDDGTEHGAASGSTPEPR